MGKKNDIFMFINLLLKFSISFHYECTHQSPVLFHNSRDFVHNTRSAFGGRSCTYDVPDTGSLELHEAPRVFSCHISVVADIWIFMPAQHAPAPRRRVGPAVCGLAR